MTNFFRPTKGTNENAGTIALALWLVVTAVLILAYFVSAVFDALLGDEPWQSLTVSFSSAIPALLFALAAPALYRRPMLTLITRASKFRWRIFFVGAAIWGSLLIAGTVIGVLLWPGELQWNFNASAFFPMLLVCVVMIPIQVASEEVVYRGLIPQALARAVRSDKAVIALSSILFALPHLLNPEAQAQPGLAFIAYGAISLGWALAVHWCGGLEISLGAHLINNVFGILIVGYANAVVTTAPLWMGPEPQLTVTAMSSAVTVSIWLAGMRWILRNRPELVTS